MVLCHKICHVVKESKKNKRKEHILKLIHLVLITSIICLFPPMHPRGRHSKQTASFVSRNVLVEICPTNSNADALVTAVRCLKVMRKLLRCRLSTGTNAQPQPLDGPACSSVMKVLDTNERNSVEMQVTPDDSC